MWGSNSSSTNNNSSPSARRSNKHSSSTSSSSRRPGGPGGGGGGAYPYINEDAASKIFDDICDEDDPNVAGMEGEFFTSLIIIIIVRML